MRYNNNTVICSAQGVQKANHQKYLQDQGTYIGNATEKTKQRKELQVDTHTKEGVIPPVMVTVTK